MEPLLRDRMVRNCLIILVAALAAGPLSAQFFEQPPFNATGLGNQDNHRLVVVQPSRVGSVVIQGRMTGTTGWIGVPLLSLAGNYAASNAGIQDTFCSLDLTNDLLFPNSAVPDFMGLFPSILPMTSGVWHNLPAFDLAFWGLEGLALYMQVGEATVVNPSPLELAFHFSRGQTYINREPVARPRPTPPLVPGAHFGRTLVTGDVNGDGVDDLVVGCPADFVDGQVAAGRVYIYLGRQRTPGVPGGLSDVPYLLQQPDLESKLFPGGNVPPGVATGPESNAHFGSSVLVDDLDGDGVAEIAVASPDSQAFSAEPLLGHVLVFNALELQMWQGPPLVPTILQPNLDEIVRVRPAIQNSGDRFGWAMTSGDLDGDQVRDLVIASPFRDGGPAGTADERGAVYAWFGPIAPVPQFNRNADTELIDVLPQDFARFGATLAAGDVDADGSDEIVVGIPGGVSAGIPAVGRVSLFDWTGVGWLNLLTFEPQGPEASAGFGRAIAVGDVNGDGFADVACGSDGSWGPNLYAGRVSVFRMGPGLSWTEELFTSPTGMAIGRFGFRLMLEDLNADGLADLTVGAPGTTLEGQIQCGAAYVYFATQVPVLDHALRRLELQDEVVHMNQLFGSSLTAGDFAGVGVQDLIVGVSLAPGLGGLAVGKVVEFPDLLRRQSNPTIQEILNGTWAPGSPSP